jgi:hypothetical protein
MRLLSDQVFIVGERRISDIVLLDFSANLPEGERPLFVPETRIAVTIFAPGPAPGPFSDKYASGVMEMVRLVCTLALGRVVDAPPSIFPASKEVADLARQKRLDSEILTLARDSISLDVLVGLQQLGGVSSMLKVRNSLVAYDAAIRQSNPDVATILFVSGMEAIAAPETPWKRARLVSRFIRAVLCLCSDAVDDLLAHQNLTEAFTFVPRGGPNKRRRKLLEQMYNLRSAPVHAGPSMSASLMEMSGSGGSARVALLSELHWKMILSYLQSPVSFLVGHPDVDPAATKDPD